MCNGLVNNTSPSVNASPSDPATSVLVKPTATEASPEPVSGATVYNKVVSFATIFTSALFVLFFVYWLWAVIIVRVLKTTFTRCHNLFALFVFYYLKKNNYFRLADQISHLMQLLYIQYKWIKRPPAVFPLVSELDKSIKLDRTVFIVEH